MFKNRKIIFLIFCLLLVGFFIWVKIRTTIPEPKPNPVPIATIKQLAETYKPTVVFDRNTLFFPVRFDGLKKIALEVNKKVVDEILITDSLRYHSNQFDHPIDLFDSPPDNSLVYYYSLSTTPENWQKEKVQTSFPDTLSLYVNASFDELLKITYTIPFEGNSWRNFHRGDGAMFALYFEKNENEYQPVKVRAYMHLQYSEISYDQNALSTSTGQPRPVFFISSGSHSTYHRPGTYKDVDGLPFLNVSEFTRNDYAYCAEKIQLVFTDETRNNIEKWAFLGEVYWGGSPNDRIFNKDDFVKKIPGIRNIPMGNKSAKMIYDPSAVFDKKHYKNAVPEVGQLIIKCQ